YPTCTSRATVTQVTQLSSGRQELLVGQVTAAGKPPLTFVARRSGRYVLDPNRGCWRNNQPGLDRGAPFVFDRNERLTIVGRRGGYTTLKGTIPHDFVETDRINTRTHELRSLEMAFISRPRDKMTLRFRTVGAGPAAPDVTPACW